MTKLSLLSGLCYRGQNGLRLVLVVIFTWLLFSCSSHYSTSMVFDKTKGSQYYSSQFLSSSGSDKTNWQLLTVRAFLAEDNVIAAQNLFSQVSKNLNKIQQQEYFLLQGELAIKNDRSFDLNQLNLLTLTDEQAIRYYLIKIALDGEKKNINAQIRDYIALEKLGTIERRHQTINETWLFLTSLDEESINNILVYANEPILQGWIDLLYIHKNRSNAYIIDDKDDINTLEKKETAQLNVMKNLVNEWQMQYSEHPAALYLPRNVYGEKHRLPDDTSKKSVALFLPLSGPSKVFGDVIRLGYFDAHQFYPNESEQNIYIYDTNSNTLDVLLQKASQQGAEVIVGPLLKDDVLNIMKLSPSIPVLALNKIDYKSSIDPVSSSKICFFALSPEDDARDAANHIYHQNKKRPLLIVPKNDLGDRVIESFIQQWRLLESEPEEIYVQYFESEKALSDKINQGIGIELEGTLFVNEEQALAQENPLDNLVNEVLANNDLPSSELLPPRPEFDSIYIYSSHNELTLIKSMLEMKSNKVELDEEGNPILDENGNEISIIKNIPSIYSSSRSHIANTTQDFRYDMDKMQFSDIPLIAKKTSSIDELPSYIKNDYSLVRLYAMGIDAWQLVNHFNQLDYQQIDIIDGMTGKLSVTEYCEINRTLIWQKYRNGKNVIIQ